GEKALTELRSGARRDCLRRGQGAAKARVSRSRRVARSVLGNRRFARAAKIVRPSTTSRRGSRAAGSRGARRLGATAKEECEMRRLPVLLALILVPALAEAQSGVQWTRERDATLVSKDVGPERWAITYRLSDGRVTGNVFRTDGGPTSFLDCTQTSLVD